MANWAKLQEDIHGLPVAKRAKHGIHFDKGNGEILANFVGSPCHYFEGGLWKPIDTKLIAMPGGYYGCPHSDIKIHSDGRVVVDKSDYQQFTELPSAKAGKVDGDKIIRTFSGGEQWLIVTENGFREEIHLTKRGMKVEKFVAKTSGKLPGKYQARAITAIDADGESYEYTGDTKAFGDWLDSARYPVVIDPDFGGGTADGYKTVANVKYAVAHGGDGAISDYSELRIGQYGAFWYIYRAGVLFDTSSIGSESIITQANLAIYCNTNSYSATDCDFVIKKHDWVASGVNAFSGILAADADDSVLGNFNEGTGWITSGNLSTAWVSKTGTTYYGLLCEFDNINDQTYAYAKFDAGDDARKPTLSVAYTAGGALLKVNMNGQMQNLSGGMRG